MAVSTSKYALSTDLLALGSRTLAWREEYVVRTTVQEAPGFSAVLGIFCECGNQMDMDEATGNRYCSNPSCKHRAQMFRVDLNLIPVSEHRL